MINTILSLFLGYFLGCLQSSYFLGKIFKGIDIREHGVNNAGASNAVVVMGWKFGILTGLGDLLKAVVAVLIARTLWPNMVETWFAAGAGAFLGHCFPFFMQFRGGKGTATLIGMAFAIDIKIGLICFITIVATALISDYVVVGTVSLLITFLATAIFFDYPLTALFLLLSLSLISLYKHWVNFVRLYKGQENQISMYLKRK